MAVLMDYTDYTTRLVPTRINRIWVTPEPPMSNKRVFQYDIHQSLEAIYPNVKRAAKHNDLNLSMLIRHLRSNVPLDGYIWRYE